MAALLCHADKKSHVLTLCQTRRFLKLELSVLDLLLVLRHSLMLWTGHKKYPNFIVDQQLSLAI